MSRVLVFIDTREAASGIVEYFGQYDCEVQKKMLLLGDFVLSDRVVVERKVTQDFIKSIIDKRLFQQLSAMKENFEKPILIIEGEESLYGYLQPNIIRGALAAITVDLSIPIIWTRDMADTAGVIYWIARREQFQEKREAVLRNKKNPETLEEKQEYLVSSLPGISRVRAKALLEHFKSPQYVFNASVKELQEVKGIGKKIAEKIKKVIENQY
jgi:Fanconi anemia group M protein